MRILALADEEVMAFWDHYVPGRLKEYDLILSSGDLHAAYLSFIVTMARAPVMYVHGNHDTGYAVTEPEGCDSIDGQIVEYRGLRILGLGGCVWYRPGAHQYTEREMRKRIRKLRWEIAKYGGVDIVVTHAPPRNLGDDNDPAHWGFEALLELLDKYNPQYLIHGHVHSNYGMSRSRIHTRGSSTIINAFERYTLDIPDREVSPRKRNHMFWLHGQPKYSDDSL